MKKAIVLTDPGRTDRARSVFRPTGAQIAGQVLEQNGYKLDIIDYCLSWTCPKLCEYADEFFNDASEIIVSISFTLIKDGHDVIEEFAAYVKASFANVTVTIGGLHYNNSAYIPSADIAFEGRSEQLMDMFLQDKSSVDAFKTVNSHGIESYEWESNPAQTATQEAHAIRAHSSQVCVPSDLLGFELGVGCKFDCTFCSYDYRAMKTTTNVSPAVLHDMLEYNYKTFGITQYSICDDTINETDAKLELLADVVSRLSFKPEFNAFVRLDVIAKRPHQINLFKRCNINSHAYGIETLNPSASKYIGKVTDGVIDILRKIKTEFPECYTGGLFIVGLTKDSEESLYEFATIIKNERLLNSSAYGPLHITKNRFTNRKLARNYSKIDKTPEKYGYNIIECNTEDHDTVSPQMWENNWINYDDALELSDELNKYVSRGYPDVSSHSHSSMRASGVINYTIADAGFLESRKHISEYISRKFKYLRS